MINALEQPLVFCDVETTGGHPHKHRVTEIACIRYENGVEVARLDTLVNPHAPIPFNIQIITNINNAMTEGAPDFADIADEVQKIFEDATLVAQHSRFDFGFIKAEMERAGYEFNPPQICTAKLSRRLYSQYRGHGLSKIIDRFGFECKARHRAMGDTEVLVQFAEQMEKDHSHETILAAISHSKGKFTLPPNLSQELIDSLPNRPGVYTFVGENGEYLYIGKSVDIRSRVLSHFSNANRDLKSRRIWAEVYDIEYEETAADFSAQLLEIHKIKNEMPIYNRRLRKNERLWGLVKSEDVSGYRKFDLKPINTDLQNDIEKVYSIYRTKSEAKKSLESIVRENKLCPKLMGIENGRGECFSSQLDVCSGACKGQIDSTMYNMEIDRIFANQKLRQWPFSGPKELIFKTEGRHEKFVIDDWKLIEAKVLEDQEEYDFFVHGNQFDYDIYKVLSKAILKA
jgi:DNA polymerase-3 subunit epsilon